jgi:WD40 repeat protein
MACWHPKPTIILACAFLSLGSMAVLAQSGAAIDVVPVVGHSSGVTSVSFSRPGATALSASRDKSVKLWHTGTGRLLRDLKGPRDEVDAATFSPDGSQIAAGCIDGTIMIWRSLFLLMAIV